MSDAVEIDLLLVEDNPDDLELELRALQKANLRQRVHVSRDGAEAADYLYCEGEHAQRDPQRLPKVILLDLKLPKISGLELLRRIRSDARTKNIPVAVLTSSREQQDLVESYQLGVNSYVVKPVDFEGFSTAVQNLGLYWLHLNEPPASSG